MFSKSVLLFAMVLSVPGLAQAKVFLSLDEALAQAFPVAQHCESHAENRYLTADQMTRAQELAGSPASSALVVRYVGRCNGKPAGVVYTDSHRVRTHQETLFILIDPQGKVEKVEVLSFDEPLDYIPKGPWYETFKQVDLSPDLQIKQKIPFVTGASLTGQATVQATRRALALDQLLQGPKEKKIP